VSTLQTNSPTPSTDPPKNRLRSAWLWASLLLVAIFLYRLGLSVLTNIYELAGDEAQYWDWSRRIDWSYYTKGPGIAWAIGFTHWATDWLTSSQTGSSPWQVRLTSLLTWTGCALLVGLIAREMVPRQASTDVDHVRSIAFAAGVIAFVLCPAMYGAGQFATIDMPYLMFWGLLIWAAIKVSSFSKIDASCIVAWLILGAAVGISFLFKYTALLVLPGLCWMTWFASPRSVGRAKRWLIGWALAMIMMLITMLPVLIWNVQHGWPTVAHLLGHLHVEGGDIETTEPRAWSPWWVLGYLGLQLGMVGPGLWILIVAGSKHLWKRPAEISETPTDETRVTQNIMRGMVIITGIPLLFYLLVSLRTDSEANWPIASYVSAMAIVGCITPKQWQRYREKRQAWLALPTPRPKQGFTRKQPETWWQVGRDWSIVWGVAAILGLSLGPTIVRSLNALGLPIDSQQSLKRVAGHQSWAQSIANLINEIPEQDRQDLLYATDRYGETALLAYYLPNQPSVLSIESIAGGRESSYDYFEDTFLWADNLKGRSLIAVGSTPSKWERVLNFDHLEILDEELEVYLLTNYQGPKANQPSRKQLAPGISLEIFPSSHANPSRESQP